MQNRIDIDFDEKGFQWIRSSAQTLLSNLQKYTRSVSLKERKDGQSMGETMGWTYAQKALIKKYEKIILGILQEMKSLSPNLLLIVDKSNRHYQVVYAGTDSRMQSGTLCSANY